MTEYSETVERQKILLEAEEWSKGVESLHGFDTRKVTMAYDNHLEDGNVLDVTYNDGRIERQKDGKVIRVLGKKLEGDDLISKYTMVK